MRAMELDTMVTSDRFSKVQELIYELKVCDAMTREVVVVTPDRPMHELRAVLKDNRISGVPVVDGDALAGIISMEDFIKWMGNGSADCAIGTKMATGVHTVYEDDPLILAVSRFDQSHVGRLPVLNRADDKLVGVLTKGDVVAALLRQMEVDYHEEEIHRYRASHIFEDIIADEVIVSFKSSIQGKDFAAAGRASSNLKKALSRLNLHPHIVRRASIASFEAEMNVVVFADSGEIAVDVRPERINIDIRDSGPGIPDIDKACVPGYSTAPEWVREKGFGAGMGLPNIKKCADTLNIDSTVGEGSHLAIVINTDTDNAEQDTKGT
jgi:CBS domain-containing protein/anti-sigma regulatory factor (Ser/Thr protein kinase)